MPKIRPWWDGLLGRIRSQGSNIPFNAALNFLSPLRATHNPATSEIDVKIDPELLDLRVAQITVSGSHQITVDDWGGQPSVSVPLFVYVDASGTSTITFPTDTSRVKGCIIHVVKAVTTSGTVNVDPAGATIDQHAGLVGGTTTSSFGVNLGFPTSRFEVSWVYDGNAWVAFTRTGVAGLGANALHLNGYTIPARANSSSGASSGLAAGEDQILGRVGTANLAFSKTNDFSFKNDSANGGNPTLKVAPEATAQVSSLADAANQNYDFSIDDDGIYRAAVTVTAKRATTGDYRTYDAIVYFTRESVAVALIGSAVAAAAGNSTSLTVTITGEGSSLRVNVDNGTSETLNGYVHLALVRSDLVA